MGCVRYLPEDDERSVPSSPRQTPRSGIRQRLAAAAQAASRAVAERRGDKGESGRSDAAPTGADGKGAGPDGDHVVRKVPDDLPRDDLFAQPLVVTDITVREPIEHDDGSFTARFRVTVKDAEGKRCPNLAVEGTVVGPERTGSGLTQTNLMGQVLFHMHGPAGTYHLTVDDVAARALDLDRDASVLEASAEIP